MILGGLNSDENYLFKVRAINDLGIGPFSDSTSIYTIAYAKHQIEDELEYGNL
jgi:hypothetical protein